MIKNTSIIVRNKKTAYGTVELSPDSELSILGITNRLMNRYEVEVTNLPRSLLFLSYLEVLENLGFTLIWENYNYLKIKFDSVAKIRDFVSADIMKSASPKLLTFIIPLLLKIKGETEVDVSYKDYIDEAFLKNLDMEISTVQNRILISTPLESSVDVTLKYDMESLDMDFLFNKFLMKNIFPKLRIVLPDYHVINTANILLDDIKDVDVLVCPPSIMEFKFFCSLLMLLGGEVEFSGYDLKYFLSHLLRFVELGLFYEVIDNKLRVWMEPKDINLEYYYKDISTQDLALLILLETLRSKHNVRNIIPYKKHFENLIKELNICGCRIDYKTYTKNGMVFFDLLVKPSTINSVKVNLYENLLALNMAILLPVFCVEGKGRAESVNLVEYTLSNFRDNLGSINLDIIITSR